MTHAGLNAWEILFRRALEIVDSVASSGTHFDDWSFGGGTVLMRRYRHRVSKDVDLFVPDPQYLGDVSPRLNDTAESLTSKYLETANSVKLFFPEGEIDFIASAPLTEAPTVNEIVLGRRGTSRRRPRSSRKRSGTAEPSSRRATSSTSRSSPPGNPA